jgi:hypothetical protein
MVKHFRCNKERIESSKTANNKKLQLWSDATKKELKDNDWQILAEILNLDATQKELEVEISKVSN